MRGPPKVGREGGSRGNNQKMAKAMEKWLQYEKVAEPKVESLKKRVQQKSKGEESKRKDEDSK